MFGTVRNALNSTKNRAMMSSASQVLEHATRRNHKGLRVDISFSTNMDQKRWPTMLTATSMAFPKGGLLTWLMLALKGESDKDVGAIARKICAYAYLFSNGVGSDCTDTVSSGSVGPCPHTSINEWL